VLRPWWFALAAAGVMLFIAYGSYVPFEVQPRAWGDATAAFQTAMGRWASPGSRSDFVANIALGVPLGFCLLGALRVDRRGRWQTVAMGVPVVLAGGLFAAAVEFGQLYVRGRVCSGADITAQSIGAAVGVLGWVAAGRWVTENVRRAFDADSVRGTTTPLLVGYAGLLLLVQTLPLDLTASPYDLHHRLKEKATWVPFGELTVPPDDPPTVADWCELFALDLPAGLLLAGLRGPFGRASGWPWVVGVGLLAATLLELCQVLVVSRHPSTTDVLVGGAGVTAGWVVARILTGQRVKTAHTGVALALGLVWSAVLAAVAWHPYQFAPGVFAERLGAMSWLPLREAVQGPYLWAAEDLLAKFALFLPLGAVAVWGRCPVWAAVGLCGLAATVLELGQAMLPARTVCPTDVLVAAAGGWVGAAVGRKVGAASRAAPVNSAARLAAPT
jgi:VanZ family protein